MGVVAHHAIVVTSYEPHVTKAHGIALDLFPAGYVSPLSPSLVNGFRTFCVFPDGSKEGWDESMQGDEKREEFVRWLRSHAYDDGSSPYEWAEVHYGEIDGGRGNPGAVVTHHAWAPRKVVLSPTKERRRTRRDRAVELRSLGITLKEIGRTLGCSAQTVRELLAEAQKGTRRP